MSRDTRAQRSSSFGSNTTHCVLCSIDRPVCRRPRRQPPSAWVLIRVVPRRVQLPLGVRRHPEVLRHERRPPRHARRRPREICDIPVRHQPIPDRFAHRIQPVRIDHLPRPRPQRIDLRVRGEGALDLPRQRVHPVAGLGQEIEVERHRLVEQAVVRGAEDGLVEVRVPEDDRSAVTQPVSVSPSNPTTSS